MAQFLDFHALAVLCLLYHAVDGAIAHLLDDAMAAEAAELAWHRIVG